MKPSRSALVRLLLLCVVSTLVAAGVEWHRRDAWEDLSRPMMQLGMGIYLYSREHHGKTPPSVEALVAADMVRADFPRRVRDKVHYIAGGRDFAALPPNAVLAVQDPRRYGDYVYVSVLLADGSVVGVKPEALAGVPLHPDVLLLVHGQSSNDFRITTSPAEPQPPR